MGNEHAGGKIDSEGVWCEQRLWRSGLHAHARWVTVILIVRLASIHQLFPPRPAGKPSGRVWKSPPGAFGKRQAEAVAQCKRLFCCEYFIIFDALRFHVMLMGSTFLKTASVRTGSLHS
jgi:hypothetical protein